ncbi:IucA/IucC family protein, partial [Paracoccus sp. (in: a-proteobacteria)]|uniref:IucA/IucC family protein n=1 Tax=Paracoccus sp. TaxID=267 RepID=UPI003A84ECF8
MSEDLRDIPALDAFLNAALRENVLTGARIGENGLAIPTGRGTLLVPLAGQARFRLRFSPGLRLAGRPCPVAEGLALLAHPFGQVFAARVGDSAMAIRRAPWRAADDDPALWNFQQAEAAMRYGHPCHPNPRSRDEMNAQDARRYAPEFGTGFALTWLAVPREAVAAPAGALVRLARLARADEAPEPADSRHIRLPVHPWQAVAQADRIAAAGARILGEGQGEWRATASMRTLHGWHADVMLKMSLSLRLTNSTRVLHPREMRRGADLAALLDGPVGQDLRASFPQMHILREAHHAALRNGAGLIPETLVSLRDNPFRDPRRSGPVMLGSLCEPVPGGGSALVRLIGAGDARGWFRRFLRIAILPLLELRATHGLLFGAHQQNMMIGLDADRAPVSVWLRDCQGTGHLADFHDRLAQHCPDLGRDAGNVVTAELGDALLTYYVVVNGVLHLLSTMALDGLAHEDDLLRDWRDF